MHLLNLWAFVTCYRVNFTFVVVVIIIIIIIIIGLLGIHKYMPETMFLAYIYIYIYIGPAILWLQYTVRV